MMKAHSRFGGRRFRHGFMGFEALRTNHHLHLKLKHGYLQSNTATLLVANPNTLTFSFGIRLLIKPAARTNNPPRTPRGVAYESGYCSTGHNSGLEVRTSNTGRNMVVVKFGNRPLQRWMLDAMERGTCSKSLNYAIY